MPGISAIRRSPRRPRRTARAGWRGDLARGVGAHVVLRGRAGDDEAGRDREQQRGDLGDQAVADGQQAVGVRRPRAGSSPRCTMPIAKPPTRLISVMMMAAMASPLTNLLRTVHRAVEVGLVGDLVPAACGPRCSSISAGVEVGVDRHLLAGHGVEGEPGGDLGDAAGTVGDDDELDDDQDQEDDQADDDRAADDEVAERLDDLAGVAVAEDEPGRGDVERRAGTGWRPAAARGRPRSRAAA